VSRVAQTKEDEKSRIPKQLLLKINKVQCFRQKVHTHRRYT